MTTHTTTTTTTMTSRLLTTLAVLLGALSMVACGAPEECSSDDDCQAGYQCFRSRSGWVQSSVCAPSDPAPDVIGPDGGDTSFPDLPMGCGVLTCNPPIPGAQCEEDRTTVCALQCQDGVNADCDGDMQNGCEVSLLTDADNCGTCGTVCNDQLAADHVTGVCMTGSCRPTACVETWYDLDDDPSNGCSIQVDPALGGESNQMTAEITAVERVPGLTFVAFGSRVGLLQDGVATVNEPMESWSGGGTVVQLRASAVGTTEYAVALLNDGSIHGFEFNGNWELWDVDDGTQAEDRVVDIGDLRDRSGRPDVIWADRTRVTCEDCEASSSVGGMGPAVGRIIDVEVPNDVRALFFSAHGVAIDGIGDIATADHLITGSSLDIAQGNLPNLQEQPTLVEPWLDASGAVEGMVMYFGSDGRLEFHTYSSASGQYIRSKLPTTFEIGTGVEDIVSLGGDRFVAMSADKFTLFSTDEDEPALLDFTISELDPGVADRDLRSASWTPGDSILSLAYGQRLYTVPITIDP